MSKNKSQTKNDELSAEDWDYLFNLEKEWQFSSPRFSEGELLRIFPEAKEEISEMIKELYRERGELIWVIKKKLRIVKMRTRDEFSRWFWREWIKVNEGTELLQIDRDIAKLKRSLLPLESDVKTGRITEKHIQRALNVPILDIASEALALQKIGGRYRALCPFHSEKHPSFYIFPQTNSFYCFGCQTGGNLIKFVKLFYNLNFIGAVRWLGENY